MDPEQLGHELREGRTEYLRNRRRIAGLSLAAAGSMGVITLYQMGLIRHLPDLPLPRMDADKVDASPEAYRKLSMPDAALGLTSYGVTLALAAMGDGKRWRERPWLPLLLATKVGVDAAQAAKLTRDQWTRHGAFCSWCLLAAGATFAAVPLAWPEAREAGRHLLGRSAEADERSEGRAARRWSPRRSPETWPIR